MSSEQPRAPSILPASGPLRSRSALGRIGSAMLVGALATLGISGCGDRPGPEMNADSATGAGTPSSSSNGELLVSAAASLTDAFRDVSEAFEARHPGVFVSLNLAGSSTLRAQILEGAPVDVFASANTETMRAVDDARQTAQTPQVFALNRLIIAVPPGNPAGVTGLPDFAREELLVGLCAPPVPCGDFALQALNRAGIAPAPDTEEPDVRALLTKVELAELDAAITYVTDVAAADGSVQAVEIPDSWNVTAEYLIAPLAGSPHPVVARSFVAFVLSNAGREILSRHGFGLP